MRDLFLNTDTGAESASVSEAELLKSLNAGYGTDAAQFPGGRAMVPEDCEILMMNAMREQQEDCKMMNTIKKRPVKSTVHEYNRRLDAGDYENATAEEGGGSVDTDQQIERVTRQIKFLQVRRAVTDQMEVVDGFESAFESEKLAGTLTVLKAAERLCFHGDSEVVPTEFDGIPKQILRQSVNKRIVNDARGNNIQSLGDEFFSKMALTIYDAGGDCNKLFFPPVLGMDIQELCKDRIRFGANDTRMTPVFDSYPTPFGTIKFGETEGPDKFFRVKGVISPNGNVQTRPAAPASVGLSAGTQSGSLFAAADAGNYVYTVHAVNKYGISVGTSAPAAIGVSSGQGVTITITPDANNPGTGFIICRSKAGGTVAYEMVRIARDTQNATTVYIDKNEDLPGTAQALFLTEKKLQPVVEFYQLMGLRMRPLWENNRAEKPFFMQLYGAIDLKVPEWCGITKNIGYSGGLYNG